MIASWRPVLIALLLCGANTTIAATSTPVGTWQQISKRSGKPHALIRITENNGTYQGTLIKLLNRTPKDIAKRGEHPRCTLCSGAQKNQLFVGLTVLWDLKQDGDHWSGGHVLDPTNGKVYKAQLSLENGGQALKVRGYVGLSLFGRTQILRRQPEL